MKRSTLVVRWFILTCLVVALMSATALGASRTLVQWDWFDKSTKEGSTWWAFVEEHLKEAWDVELELGIAWDEAKVPVSISSGVVIDSIQIPFHQAVNWTQAGLLYPITQYIDRDETMDWNDFIPGVFDPVTKDGEVYALPWIMDFELILLNADLWRELGLDPKLTDTWDWDEFLDVAKKLTVHDSEGEVTRAGFSAWMNRWTWMTFLFSNGGQFFNDDLTAAAFNTPVGLETLEFLTDLHLTHRVMRAGLEGEDHFIAGRSGMMITGPWVEAFFDFPMEFDFAMIPKGPSATQSSTRAWINYRAIPATTSDPDLAWQYLSWYNSMRGPKYEMIGTHRSPYLPFYFTDEWEASIDERPWMHKVPQMLQLATIDPQYMAEHWSDPVNILIMEALGGQRSPIDALNQAETIVNAALQTR